MTSCRLLLHLVCEDLELLRHPHFVNIFTRRAPPPAPLLGPGGGGVGDRQHRSWEWFLAVHSLWIPPVCWTQLVKHDKEFPDLSDELVRWHNCFKGTIFFIQALNECVHHPPSLQHKQDAIWQMYESLRRDLSRITTVKTMFPLFKMCYLREQPVGTGIAGRLRQRLQADGDMSRAVFKMSLIGFKKILWYVTKELFDVHRMHYYSWSQSKGLGCPSIYA